MTVPFNSVPADIRVPGVYNETDDRFAGVASELRIGRIVGQRLAGGSVAEKVSTEVSSAADARAKFGYGSQVAEMVANWRLNDPTGKLIVIALDDDPSAAHATKSITYSGTATETRSLNLYVGDERLQVTVSEDDTAATVAAAIADKVCEDLGDELSSGSLTVGQAYEITAVDGEDFTADGATENTVGQRFIADDTNVTLDANDKVKPIITTIPVIANVTTAAPAVVTFTAKHGGTIGNDIKVHHNWLGVAGGEQTPAGISISGEGYLASGATDPDYGDFVDTIGDAACYCLACGLNDTTALGELKTEWQGRWTWNRQLWGGMFAARRDSVSTLAAAGPTYGDAHLVLMGQTGSPTPFWRFAASLAARAFVRLNNHSAVPLTNQPLYGVTAPAEADRHIWSERSTLLAAGIATFLTQSDGTVVIERAVTTKQTDANDAPSMAWRDVNNPYTLQEWIERVSAMTESKFGGKIIVDDGAIIADGAPVVTPTSYKSELVALYADMAAEGYLEDVDTYKTSLIVERDSTDPNRLNAYHQPDLANQLLVVAGLHQFIV